MDLYVFERNSLKSAAFQALALSRKRTFYKPGTHSLCYLFSELYRPLMYRETEQNKYSASGQNKSTQTHSYHPRSLKASGLSGLMITVLEDRTDRLLPPKSETRAPLMAITGCLEPSNCSAYMCEKTENISSTLQYR